ncbi:MAG: hypothetical protein VX990_03675, partial [Pseudomonadota bacterium]|nr:hypothetical protein [Pseudomonadota bacterium]
MSWNFAPGRKTTLRLRPIRTTLPAGARLIARDGETMPREFRRITFSYEELPEALNSCGAKVSKKLSKGSITSVISKMIDGSFFYSFQLFD